MTFPGGIVSFALSRRLTAALAVLLAGTTVVGPSLNSAVTAAPEVTAAPARDDAGSPTPGNFTGKAFDQCNAPSQHAMDAWLHSTYRGVGIYISGPGRACPRQRNLTRSWVRTQLAHGWKLLPIDVGPQAACNHHAHRTRRISANPANGYGIARAQARAEADGAARAARRLGLAPRSTVFYDLEAFSTSSATCRNSSLSFLSAWTQRLRSHGYTSGVYSSASSGIRLIDHVRAAGTRLALPEQLWVADWNGRANTHSSYLRPEGWRQARVKQYRGSHNERHGGVRINVDSNYVDLRLGGSDGTTGHSSGRPTEHRAAPRRAAKHADRHAAAPHHRHAGRKNPTRATPPREKSAGKSWTRVAPSAQTSPRPKHEPNREPFQEPTRVPLTSPHLYLPQPAATVRPAAPRKPDRSCGHVKINRVAYPSTGNGKRIWLHSTLQCVLKQNGLYSSPIDGTWGKRTAYGLHKMQARTGHDVKTKVNRADWVSLLVAGNKRTRLTRGVRDHDVVRLQRALHAAGLIHLHINGTYDHATARAVRVYQRRVGVPATGVVGRTTWRYLEHGHV